MSCAPVRHTPQALLAAIPADRLLVESDAPDGFPREEHPALQGSAERPAVAVLSVAPAPGALLGASWERRCECCAPEAAEAGQQTEAKAEAAGCRRTAQGGDDDGSQKCRERLLEQSARDQPEGPFGRAGALRGGVAKLNHPVRRRRDRGVEHFTLNTEGANTVSSAERPCMLLPSSAGEHPSYDSHPVGHC